MEDITAVSSRTVPPDPSIADALGAHHELPTALADLVDNSIDAGASQVRIRILTDDDYVTGMLVIDDGHGMDEAGIDAAMALSRRRDYGETDLGHYGLGLKAASLSQADTLDVYTRAIGGLPVGRRITRDEPTRVQTLDAAQVGRVLDGPLARTGAGPHVSGTVVHWLGFHNALTSPDREERRSWLSGLVEYVRDYLGLVFQRIIERGGVEISIDEYDVESERAGSARRVRALDPLARQAAATRSHLLVSEVGRTSFNMTATILSGTALTAPGVLASQRLSSAKGGQGLYIYRRDRLLQLGGWSYVTEGGRDYENLRIAIDVDDSLLDVVRINPEKSGVVLEPEMRRAIHGAVGEEIGTFNDLLDAAQDAAMAGRRRQRRPVELVEPVGGLSREVYDVIGDSVEFAGADPIRIRWSRMPEGRLIDVDIEQRVLKLNERHRRLFSASTDPQDAPLLKTLVYLIYSRFFEGSFLGAREKREIEAFERIIDAALSDELRRRTEEE
ncbi:ATP-binding protein [Actinomyces timonensis]|uniref:ATP-binding protein n=1 Tax=Actinomyces timonensis TaxID=1288391 RepID=UPI00030471BC|nr:ATP-binding protein [Actinomyces timonensis]